MILTAQVAPFRRRKKLLDLGVGKPVTLPYPPISAVDFGDSEALEVFFFTSTFRKTNIFPASLAPSLSNQNQLDAIHSYPRMPHAQRYVRTLHPHRLSGKSPPGRVVAKQEKKYNKTQRAHHPPGVQHL